MTRVLIVEDDPRTLSRMAEAIEAAEGLTLAGTAETLCAARSALDDAPDLLLVDLRLGDQSGLDLIAEARDRTPEARILVVTMFGDEHSTVAAIEAGADGYVLKGDPRVDLVASINRIIAGEAPISPAIARHLLRRLQGERPAPAEDAPGLTPREAQVLQALAAGQSYKETAHRLDLSTHTVNFHVRSLYKKLSARSRGEAVRIALEHGMIRLGG